MRTDIENEDSIYKILVQNVVDYAIYVLNVDGIVISWNAGAEKAKGYSASEILGKNFSVFYSEEERAQGLPEKALYIARSAGKFEGDGWRFRKDGSRLRAHVVIDPIYDEEKTLIGYAKITKDITVEYQSKILADEQSRNFRLMTEGIKDYIMYMIDRQGIILNWNAGAQRAKGYFSEEVIGKHFSIFYLEEDRQSGLPYRDLASALARGKLEREGFRTRRNGTSFWAYTSIDPVYDEDNVHIGYATITRDLTEQKKQIDKTKAVYRNLDLALSHMSQGLCLFDKNECMVICNQRFRSLLGLSEDDFQVGNTFIDLLWLLHKDSSDSIVDVADDISKKREEHFENVLLGKTKHKEYNIHGKTISSSDRFLSDGGWVSTIEDITERRRIEQEVNNLAHSDILTGLKNRTSFQKKIAKIFGKDSASLIYIDIDWFKDINDQYGHPAGDDILRMTGTRILENLSAKESIYRIGGDEFAVVCENFLRNDDVSNLCDRIIRSFDENFHTEWGEISVGVSIGVADIGGCTNIETWIQHADLALYAAKEAGRGKCLWYERGMREEIQARRQMELDLRQSLREENFFLLYQPVVNIQTKSVTSFEALLRWQHPERGIVFPTDFIPFAEETGLMLPIDLWVLKVACTEALKWPHQISVSINISASSFEKDNVADLIIAVVDDVGIAAERVEIEITETSMLINMQDSINKINKIRSRDIKIALDDFGTGYSSLSFVRDIPFNRIKIDRSFVSDIGKNNRSSAIIKAISEIGENINVSITAEGVESSDQTTHLMKDRCFEHQGYFISRPFGPEKISEWVNEYEGVVDGETKSGEICTSAI